MTITGGCIYAFGEGGETLDLYFPTKGHSVVLRGPGTSIKNPGSLPDGWLDGSDGVKIPEGYRVSFEGASGKLTLKSPDKPSDKPLAKGSAEWQKLAYVLDLTRRFEVKPSLSLQGKGYLRFKIVGGLLQGAPPSESIGFDRLWAIVGTKGTSTKELKQSLTDRTLWSTLLSTGSTVRVKFVKEVNDVAGPVEQSVEFVTDSSPAPVTFTLEGSSANGEPPSGELKHYPHLFGLLDLDMEFSNPKATDLPERKEPACAQEFAKLTPGRFCPGLQIIAK